MPAQEEHNHSTPESNWAGASDLCPSFVPNSLASRACKGQGASQAFSYHIICVASSSKYSPVCLDATPARNEVIWAIVRRETRATGGRVAVREPTWRYELDFAAIPKKLFGRGAQVRTALARKVLSMHPVESRACRSFPDTLAISSVFAPVTMLQ
jgi:hypothetical protein